MEQSYFSSQWHRVAGLKPRIRNHAKFFRLHYRGQLWYVLQDRTSGKFHRFTPASYFVASMFDGQKTTQDIWDLACKHLDADALSQDEIIRLMAQLHTADVLLGDLPPDIEEMAERGRKMRSKKRVMGVMNPMAIRVPLIDPDGFLAVTLPLVRPFFSVFGFLIWLGIIIYAGFLAAINWDGLTDGVIDRVLTAESIVLLLLAYPVVKCIHELGHAYAIKKWGGEVHEVGVMFLVFFPVPYVDASDSLSFSSKWKRAFVAGAGIMVEGLLAAIAMIVWDVAESGMVRAFAFNVMLIGGISTILFNGNPLLRFDGYYVLSDLIEIPNLGRRANQYLGYVIQKRLLGVEEPINPATARGEPAWFLFYSIASFVYRLFIFATIALLVASKFFSLGILLVIWTLFLMFGLPLLKHLKFLFTSPLLRRDRGKALRRVAIAVALAFALLFQQPFPFSTVAQGVVWVPQEGRINPQADGKIIEVAVAQNQVVAAGDVIMRIEDPLLDARVAILKATVDELGIRVSIALATDPTRTKIAREELKHAQADLALSLKRQEELTVRAMTSGRVVLEHPADLEGQFVRKGQTLGYVSTFDDPIIRAVVAERNADLVREETKRVELRFISSAENIHSASIAREVPALSGTLPSLALAPEGGGTIVLDPSSPNAAEAFENLLHLDITPDEDLGFSTLGERVYLRFVHEPESLATRGYRRVRQIFLQQFEV